MAGLAEELNTDFTLRQALAVFGTDCQLVIEDSRMRVFPPPEPCHTGMVAGVRCSRDGIGCPLEHQLPAAIADVHLPAPIRMAILNALYASYLTLPLAQIGRELQAREAA